jgi:hypothetical protein
MLKILDNIFVLFGLAETKRTNYDCITKVFNRAM